MQLQNRLKEYIGKDKKLYFKIYFFPKLGIVKYKIEDLKSGTATKENIWKEIKKNTPTSTSSSTES